MTAQFGYLLNAMERAACEHKPAEHDYKGKRIAVLGYVSALETERDRLKNLVAMAELAIGEHYAPSDCYSTGPLTGGIAAHLCPACAFTTALAAKEE